MKKLTKKQVYKIRSLVMNRLAFVIPKTDEYSTTEMNELLDLVRALEEVIKETK